MFIGYYRRMPPHQLSEAIAGRYQLGSEIGSGGMGTVWDAQDTVLKRAVAIKEVALPPAVGVDEREEIRKRVLREARAAAALNHPNAVTVYDVIEEGGKAFIVMERIVGRTLESVVRTDGPLDDERAKTIADDVLSALEAAHGSEIVHRDVKPANVMITDDGRTKLADFGIASVKDDPKITASGLVLGSPSFMAPEQATHGNSGPEADLWGLGATLYFAIEGVPPFERNGPIPTLTAVVGDDHRPMQRPTELGGAITALLAKDPAARPSPAEVRAMLTEGSPTRAATRPVAPATRSLTAPIAEARHDPTPAEPAPRSDQPERRWLWGLLAVGAAILIAVLVAMSLSAGDETEGGRREGRAGSERAAEDDGGEGAPAAADPAVVPEDWTTYEDPTLGYQIAYPSDWEVEVRDEHNTFFQAPDGTYLQVAWTQPPTAETPEEAWEAFSEEFGSSHEDYVELGITETTFQGMDAAELEFTYSEDGASLHGLDLGFITSDGSTGMALYFQTHAEEWEESQGVFEEIKASFLPPG